jgi:hypothetical protein
VDLETIKKKHNYHFPGTLLGVNNLDVDNMVTTIENQKVQLQMMATIVANCQKLAKENGEVNVSKYIEEIIKNSNFILDKKKSSQ